MYILILFVHAHCKSIQDLGGLLSAKLITTQAGFFRGLLLGSWAPQLLYDITVSGPSVT